MLHLPSEDLEGLDLRNLGLDLQDLASFVLEQSPFARKSEVLLIRLKLHEPATVGKVDVRSIKAQSELSVSINSELA